ncbi:MAG: TCP-1/cpn60 chaperonin family protein, partial [Alphaproteobacteria bacterium]
MLGSADRIKLTKDTTTIIGGAGRTRDIDQRIVGIRAEQGLAGNTPFQEKNLRERLAKLTGGVAVVRVGGISEAEISERLDRADDAVNAVRAAGAAGILPGGGAAYLHAAKILPPGKTSEERAANRILCAALASPAIRIVSNAGQDGRIMAARLADERNPVTGYDAQAGALCDLMEAGIV